MKPTDWAYLAGLIDGDGSVFISWERQYRKNVRRFVRLNPHPRIVIGLNRKEQPLLDELKKVFGGRVWGI